MTGERASRGLFGSVQRLGGTLLEVAELRLELIGTEVEREKLRIGRGLLLAAFGLALGVVALLLLSAVALLLVDPAQRLVLLVALGVTCALLAAWLLHAARNALRAPSEGAFALSRSELRRDLEMFRPPTQ